LVLSILLALPLAASGCGSKSERETAIVKGTVTFNGKPLHTGSVVMVPDGGGPTAQGRVGADGTYEMGTYTETDGAIPGKHSVMLLSIAESAGPTGLPEDTAMKRGGGQTTSIIPEKFGDLSTSGLKCEVKSGENSIDFILTDKTGEVKQN